MLTLSIMVQSIFFVSLSYIYFLCDGAFCARRGSPAVQFRSARRWRSIWRSITYFIARPWERGRKAPCSGPKGALAAPQSKASPKDAALSAFRRETFGARAPCSLHRRQQARRLTFVMSAAEPKLRLAAAATRSRGSLPPLVSALLRPAAWKPTRNRPAPTFCAWRREKPRRGTHQV